MKLIISQKIRSSIYPNFSVLGLAIVLIVGGLIIILAYTLEHLIEIIETRFRRVTKYSRLERSANDILQTQRMAHEELESGGTWDDCAGVGAVPVTAKDEQLALLDIRDPKHTRLTAPLAMGADDAPHGKVESHSTQCNSHEESGGTISLEELPDAEDWTQTNASNGQDQVETGLRGSMSQTPEVETQQPS